MAAVVLRSKKTQKLEGRIKALKDGIQRLLNGQKEQTNMLKALMLTKTTSNGEAENNKKEMGMDNDETYERRVEKYALVPDMPSFYLHLDQTQKGRKYSAKGTSSRQ
ncbi:unnamed protein product [Cuscuta europaea]|uniref:Uncharacterized protein n=1 Tax=Cuscuta europaea TaxID=41803 RepID=A0A9P1EPB9_CUSEU|nr:unnamed protein product [Cuscuta europaea]